MAYKEKVFNANVLTDLLSTYLTHRSGEREKYYQAEVVANKPQYKVVDGNLLQIDPMTGGIETLYSKSKEIKEPKFEDFPQMDKDGKPTGMTIKGVHTGTDKKIAGVPQGYEIAGKSTQYKPDDPRAEEKKIEQKNISAMVSEVARLRRLRDKDYDFETQYMITQGKQAPVFTAENKKQLDFYTSELSNRGFDIYGQEKKLDSSGASKVKKEDGSKLLQDLKNEFPAIGEGNDPPTEKDARYYFSKKGKSDFKKIVEEYEQKYPPGTYDPLTIDIEKSRFWLELEQKYLSKNLDSRLGSRYLMQYNFNIEDKFGRDGALNNPASPKAKKGSFWE